MDQVKIFEGCLPQVLFGPFLDTLTHITVDRGSVGCQILVILYVKLLVITTFLCRIYIRYLFIQFTHDKFTMDNMNDLIAAIVDVEAKRKDNIAKCLDIASQGNHY